MKVPCARACVRTKACGIFVVSRTLAAADYPEVTILRDVAAVPDLRHTAGKDIWLCGGCALLASLLGAGLVDTVELGLSPTLVGDGGTPTLGADAKLESLTSSVTSSIGVF